MKDQIIQEIHERLAECEDAALLDLILKILNEETKKAGS